jgi:hypothetical protein
MAYKYLLLLFQLFISVFLHIYIYQVSIRTMFEIFLRDTFSCIHYKSDDTNVFHIRLDVIRKIWEIME